MSGLGPNIVVRILFALTEDPAFVSATSRGHPVRLHGVAARLVKPIEPPTLPAATNERASLISRSDPRQALTGTLCVMDAAVELDPLPAPKQPVSVKTRQIARTHRRMDVLRTPARPVFVRLGSPMRPDEAYSPVTCPTTTS